MTARERLRTWLTGKEIEGRISSEELDELRTEARDQRNRLELYRARVQSPRPTTVAHLRQRERECNYAERRLSRARRRVAG